MQKLSLIAIAVLISGCVSAADKMKSYVGRDVRFVELTYGPPSNVIDMGNGVRAFQWTRVSTYTRPASIRTTTTTDVDRKRREGAAETHGEKTTETQYSDAQTEVSRCIYSFITQYRKADRAWIVVSYEEPTFGCGYGDLSS